MPTRDNGRPQATRLYRDVEHRVLCGVCAGIADYLGVSRGGTRFVAVLLFLFWFPFAFVAYVALCVLLPKKPRQLYRNEREEVFWRSVRRSPEATFGNVRHKFRDMEARMRKMERYVTSSKFKLDREFENLRNGATPEREG